MKRINQNLLMDCIDDRPLGRKIEMDKEIARLDTVVNGDLTWINLERPSRDTMEKEVASRGYPFHELNMKTVFPRARLQRSTNTLTTSLSYSIFLHMLIQIKLVQLCQQEK